MKYKSVKLLLWAVFAMLLAIYLLFLNWQILSLILLAAAIVLAICSWIVGYISDDDNK